MNVAITGGGRGIGRATAQACVRAGMSVAIGDLDRRLAAATADGLGDRAIGLGLDVRDPESFERFLDDAERAIGPLDAIVNNAGVAPIGPFRDEPPHLSRLVIDVNVTGVINGTRLALERFLPRGRGHVVNIASSAGVVATAGGATYAASKHAVVGFTRAIRAETRGTGLRTTIVFPGFTRTGMIDGFSPSGAMRIAEPEDVAAAIVAALRSGRQEVFVPREMGVLSRLTAAAPPPVYDRIKRLLGVDKVMMQADQESRAAYAETMSIEPTEVSRRAADRAMRS